MAKLEKSSEYINRISREYSQYVLKTRAIPEMSDGLKSGQRIALWLIRNRAEKIKTIALAGQMIASEMYDHGDASAAESISMLAAPYNNNNTLLDGVGTFGTSIGPTNFNAPRYTYVKRNKFAEAVLYRDLDIVPMIENYDGSVMMPETFLPLIPLVLLNGVRGTAPGWKTLILPHAFKDLVNAVLEVLSGQKILTPLLPLFSKYDVRIEKGTEENQYILYGDINIKNTNTITITKLPPLLLLEAVRKRLITMEDKGKITSWIDRSTKKVDIEIKMPRSMLRNKSVDDLIELFKIRSVVTEQIIVNDHFGSIKAYSDPETLVFDWVQWRFTAYLTRYVTLLKQEKLNLLFWELVVACFEGYEDNTEDCAPLPDAMTAMKNKTTTKAHALKLADLHMLGAIPDDVVTKVVEIPLYKWTAEGEANARKQIIESDKRSKHYTDMVGSNTKRRNQFKKEVTALLT